MDRPCRLLALATLALLLVPGPLAAQSAELGVFTRHADVGRVTHAGSVEHAAATGVYVVAGGGENMWFDTDAFHFVWKEARGDVSLAADVRWIAAGGNAHRKAGVMLRQGLEPGAAYADVVVHGDGLTSIQYRAAPGGPTREIQSNVSAPRSVRIEKEGDYVFMSVAGEGEPLRAGGGSFKIRLQEPFLVGLVVCAHDDQRLEKAVFENVEMTTGPRAVTGEPVLESTLETISIDSKDRRVVHHVREHLEAPNWSRDGASLIFNSGGALYRMPVEGGTPEPIDTGFATRCSNDHGLSPDGTELAISDQSQEGRSLIYVLPASGGAPRLVTPRGPSYWHGWSPDGKTLAYCAEREGEFDVYTIPVEGGEETRLTTAEGLDDGPDYSPDGRHVYFNSNRTGTMQIWRMNADGSDQRQVTFDEHNDWFPHPSPDGKWLVFLSYEKGVEGHPPNKDVMLRILPVEGGEIEVLARLFGGQGTINVPSWSPDSTQVAFVSYRLVRPALPPDGGGEARQGAVALLRARVSDPGRPEGPRAPHREGGPARLRGVAPRRARVAGGRGGAAGEEARPLRPQPPVQGRLAEDLHGLGFNLETQPQVFDAVYTGTETRDATLSDQHLQPYHGYQIWRDFENLRPGHNAGA